MTLIQHSRERGPRYGRDLRPAAHRHAHRGAAALAKSGRSLRGARPSHQLVVVDDRRFHRVRLVQPDGYHRLPRLHLLSRAQGISVADPHPADRPRAPAIRLSRHPPPILLGGDGLVRHVHRVRAGVDVLVLPGADGAERRDAKLPERGRHALLGADAHGVRAQPHGNAAGFGRGAEPGRGRYRLAAVSRVARPVQRRGAILLGQASRPTQGHAQGESQQDLGGPDRRRRHHHPARFADRPLSHPDGLALVGAGRRGHRGYGLSRRHHHLGGQARSRRQGYRRPAPRPWRHPRPRRQPHLCGAGFFRYFFYP